jgi:hypothetical protein
MDHLDTGPWHLERMAAMQSIFFLDIREALRMYLIPLVQEFHMEYNRRATNAHRSPYDTYGVAGKA